MKCVTALLGLIYISELVDMCRGMGYVWSHTPTSCWLEDQPGLIFVVTRLPPQHVAHCIDKATSFYSPQVYGIYVAINRRQRYVFNPNWTLEVRRVGLWYYTKMSITASKQAARYALRRVRIFAQFPTALGMGNKVNHNRFHSRV